MRSLHGSIGRSFALTAAAIVAGLLVASCTCQQFVRLIDDFEGCTGRCGWDVTGPGTAVVVSTILPGEHGLRIDGGVTVSRSIPNTRADSISELHLVADCPAGLLVTFVVAGPGGPDTGLAVPVGIETYTNVLTAYGYKPMFVLLETAVDVAVSPSRWLDVGVHNGYVLGSAGAGSGSGGALNLHTLELGGFAQIIFGRDDRRRPGYFGAGVEVGAMLPFLVVHGEANGGQVPYVAPVLLLRMWDETVYTPIQAVIQLRYLVANWSDALGKVGLPLGGLSFSIGANLSL